MKHMIMLGACLMLVALTGCDLAKKPATPETVAKAKVAAQLEGLDADTTGLIVQATEIDPTHRRVRVSGTVSIDKEIGLVLKDRVWQVADPEGEAAH